MFFGFWNNAVYSPADEDEYKVWERYTERRQDEKNVEKTDNNASIKYLLMVVLKWTFSWHFLHAALYSMYIVQYIHSKVSQVINLENYYHILSDTYILPKILRCWWWWWWWRSEKALLIYLFIYHFIRMDFWAQDQSTDYNLNRHLFHHQRQFFLLDRCCYCCWDISFIAFIGELVKC